MTQGGRLRQEAACRGQPLQGSLFWRWDLIIYEDQPRADYGVRTYDTTFNLVKSHAKLVSHLQASRPPAATCKLQCWVPADSGNRWDLLTQNATMERACQQSTRWLSFCCQLLNLSEGESLRVPRSLMAREEF